MLKILSTESLVTRQCLLILSKFTFFPSLAWANLYKESFVKYLFCLLGCLLLMAYFNSALYIMVWQVSWDQAFSVNEEKSCISVSFKFASFILWEEKNLVEIWGFGICILWYHKLVKYEYVAAIQVSATSQLSF